MTDTDQPSPPRANDEREMPRRESPPPDAPSCDVCGATDLAWLRCKLICSRCHTILMTCGDL